MYILVNKSCFVNIISCCYVDVHTRIVECSSSVDDEAVSAGTTVASANTCGGRCDVTDSHSTATDHPRGNTHSRGDRLRRAGNVYGSPDRGWPDWRGLVSMRVDVVDG